MAETHGGGDPDLWAWLATKGATIMAGALGGLVRWLRHKEQKPWVLVTSTIGGAIVAYYLAPVCAPIAAHYLDSWAPGRLDTMGVETAMSFLIGLAGLHLIEAGIVRARRIIAGK